MSKTAKKPPLGAAFSHGRKVAQDKGGGKKTERAAAQAYLKKKGRKAMGKSHQCPMCDPLIKSRFMDAFTRMQAATAYASAE